MPKLTGAEPGLGPNKRTDLSPMLGGDRNSYKRYADCANAKEFLDLYTAEYRPESKVVVLARTYDQYRQFLRWLHLRPSEAKYITHLDQFYGMDLAAVYVIQGWEYGMSSEGAAAIWEYIVCHSVPEVRVSVPPRFGIGFGDSNP